MALDPKTIKWDAPVAPTAYQADQIKWDDDGPNRWQNIFARGVGTLGESAVQGAGVAADAAIGANSFLDQGLSHWFGTKPRDPVPSAALAANEFAQEMRRSKDELFPAPAATRELERGLQGADGFLASVMQYVKHPVGTLQKGIETLVSSVPAVRALGAAGGGALLAGGGAGVDAGAQFDDEVARGVIQQSPEFLALAAQHGTAQALDLLKEDRIQAVTTAGAVVGGLLASLTGGLGLNPADEIIAGKAGQSTAKSAGQIAKDIGKEGLGEVAEEVPTQIATNIAAGLTGSDITWDDQVGSAAAGGLVLGSAAAGPVVGLNAAMKAIRPGDPVDVLGAGGDKRPGLDQPKNPDAVQFPPVADQQSFLQPNAGPQIEGLTLGAFQAGVDEAVAAIKAKPEISPEEDATLRSLESYQGDYAAIAEALGVSLVDAPAPTSPDIQSPEAFGLAPALAGANAPVVATTPEPAGVPTNEGQVEKADGKEGKGRTEGSPQGAQGLLDSLEIVGGLAKGDVVETDNGDSLTILNNTKPAKEGQPHLVEVRWDNGKETVYKAKDLAILLSPQPYVDAASGERRMSAPATIRRATPQPAGLLEAMAPQPTAVPIVEPVQPQGLAAAPGPVVAQDATTGDAVPVAPVEQAPAPEVAQDTVQGDLSLFKTAARSRGGVSIPIPEGSDADAVRKALRRAGVRGVMAADKERGTVRVQKDQIGTLDSWINSQESINAGPTAEPVAEPAAIAGPSGGIGSVGSGGDGAVQGPSGTAGRAPAGAVAPVAGEYDDSTEQLDDDITPPSGSPWTIRSAADAAAKRTPGGQVFEVDGGFVVRVPKAVVSKSATTEAPAPTVKESLTVAPAIPVPGKDAGNGFRHGPVAGERYRVGASAAMGGAVSLEKRLPAGTAATFYVGADGNLVDADGIDLSRPSSRAKVWVPKNEQESAQAQEILSQMGALDLKDPVRAELKRSLKALVAGRADAASERQPVTPQVAPDDPDAFIDAPSGGVNFGEISADQAKAIGRQAGKIRLTVGVHRPDGTGYGLAHIEAKHGKQIRGAGFDSVEAFVSEVARNFNQIRRAQAGQLLVAEVNDGDRRLLYVQLQPAKDADGDYYRINTAFPYRGDFLEKKAAKGQEVLWDGREPASTAAEQQPLSAGKPENMSGRAAPIAQGQSTPDDSTAGNPSSIQRLTRDTAANLRTGDVIVDGAGNEYRAHSARHDWLEAHPIVNGKADVSRDTTVTFLLDPAKASAYPERRNEPVYATGRNLDAATAVATHKEPGQPAEPVTAPVIAEAIKTSAAKTPLNLKEARAWLLERVDEAIKGAKPQVDAWADAKIKPEYDKEAKRVTLTKFEADAVGYVTFDVPGDGKFKVLNTRENLQVFRSKVAASSGFKDERKKTIPQIEASAAWTVINDFLEDDEHGNIYTYASAIGKPLRFGEGGDGSVTAYAVAEDIVIADGIETFIGRAAYRVTQKPLHPKGKPFNLRGTWSVIEVKSGLSLEGAWPTRDAAIAAAKKAVAKAGLEKMPGIIASHTKRAEKQREQEWLKKFAPDVLALLNGEPEVEQAAKPKAPVKVESAKPADTQEKAELGLMKDGIAGREVPWQNVPNGNDAFQYAIGRTEQDGQDAIYRRKASERGTYGGWRWEGNVPAAESTKPADPEKNEVDARYEHLLSLKGTRLMDKHSDGRALYEVSLSLEQRKKLQDSRGHFIRSDNFELKTKEAVTGNKYATGYVLIDRREQNANRAVRYENAKAGKKPVTPQVPSEWQLEHFIKIAADSVQL